MRDPSKVIAIGLAMPVLSKAQIQIFSPAGDSILVCTVNTCLPFNIECPSANITLTQWDQGKIVGLGWTMDERLVVLNEEGAYRIYDLQGEYQQHSLGTEAGEIGVLDARIHENGLVALTGSLTFLEVKGWEGGRPLSLASPGRHAPRLRSTITDSF
jgi:hypothetical protein